MTPDYTTLANDIGCWFLNAEPQRKDVDVVAKRLFDWVEAEIARRTDWSTETSPAEIHAIVQEFGGEVSEEAASNIAERVKIRHTITGGRGQ